jgi:hypothetical protein
MDFRLTRMNLCWTRQQLVLQKNFLRGLMLRTPLSLLLRNRGVFHVNSTFIDGVRKLSPIFIACFLDLASSSKRTLVSPDCDTA